MSETPATTVAVGRFNDLLARGLRSIIEGEPGLALVATDVAPGQLAKVLREHRPRVALLDARSIEDPVEVRTLSSEHPATHLLVLADRPSGLECARLLAHGAAGCLGKGIEIRDVLNAIHLASRGLRLAPRDAPGGDLGLLTSREVEVLTVLQQGRSNAQIAAELHISVETVRTHARHIYRKLGVASRRELLVPAFP